MALFFALLFLLIITWPLWRQWFYRFMSRRTEDAFRKAMGMPSRKEEQKMRREQEQRQQHYASGNTGRRNNNRSQTHTRHSYSNRIIPPEYAVDVEFTEYKNYSETTITDNDTRSNTTSFKYESQVEDVKYVEIKDK